MTVFNQILNELKDLSQKELIAIHNDYCDANQYGDDVIRAIDATEEGINSLDMTSMDDTHYVYNGNGKIMSFKHTDDIHSPLDYNSLSKWLEETEKYDDYNITIDAE